MNLRQIVPSLLLAAAALPASAADHALVGPRALGMGGANAACTKDGLAQYHNPAAFGFMWRDAEEGAKDDEPGERDNNLIGRKRFGWNIVDAQGGVTLAGDIGEYLEDLADIDYERLSNATDLSPQDVSDLVTLASRLTAIDDPGNAVLFDLNAGGAVRVGHLAVGARVFADAVGLVSQIDTSALGLSFDQAGVRTELGDAAAADTGFTGSAQAGGTYQWLTPSQQAALAGDLGTTTADPAVLYLDYQIGQAIASGVATPEQVSQLVEVLTGAIQGSDGPLNVSNNLENNLTSVLMRGLAVAEIPVSYGYAVNDAFSVGVTARLLIGRLYGTSVLVFSDDNTAVIDEIDNAYEETTTVGIDVGLMYRWPRFQVALTGHNLNAPEFDGFTYEKDLNRNGVINAGERWSVPGFQLDPQVTVAGAWMPLPTLTVEADVDLLKTDTLLPGRERQMLRVGAEWDILRFLALRGGISKDLAETDIAWLLHAGLGVNFWLMRIYLAGAVAIDDTVEYDGSKYPQEARVALGVAVDF